MAKRSLVMVEIEADGERCGPCAHRRGFGLSTRFGGVFAHACKLFGGFVREGRRVDACLRAQVDVAEDEPISGEIPTAAELLS